jgi:hypothetical protein
MIWVYDDMQLAARDSKNVRKLLAIPDAVKCRPANKREVGRVTL